MQDSLKYHLLKTLAENPSLSQRQLASELGISLGKANYCLRALIDKGMLKAETFRQSTHRARYFYMLTPRGLEEKTRVTARFLKKKLQEYEDLKAEIEQLRKEAGKQT